MNISEAYENIGNAIIRLMPDNWKNATLKIQRVEKSVEYNGTYKLETEEEKFIDVWSLEIDDKNIETIYNTITGGDNSSPNRWNRAIFKLWPNGKFDMEFIWDQELHDEIKRLNNE